MDLKKIPGLSFLAVKSIFLLAIAITITSCCPPIWSRLKKRAETEKVLLANKKLLVTDHLNNVSQNWVAEAEGNYETHYLEADSCLDIKATSGLTLWYKDPFEGDIRIQYQALVVDDGGLLDRVSDLTCFWMASDPMYPDSLFVRSEFRKSAFSRYYSLRLYSMCVGGNSNSLTYFQRFDDKYDQYHNEMKRPGFLIEYQDEAHLILPNHWYSIEITVQQGRVRYEQDGEVLVDYTDPSPLKKGWFGLRTTENHMRIRNFTTYKL